MYNTVQNTKEYLIKNIRTVTIFRVLGVFSGFILDAFILGKFGLERSTDAFFVALTIPLIIVNVFDSQGANVLVPIFIKNMSSESQIEFKFFMRNFVSISGLLLAVASLIIMGSSFVLIPIQAPGFSQDVVSLAVKLNIIVAWLIFIRGIDTLYKCLLLSYHHYLTPAIDKTISNSIAIALTIILIDHIGIYSLAIGYISGSIVSLLLMIIVARHKGFTYKLVFQIKDRKTIHSIKMFLYPLAGHGLSESKELLENFLLSFFDRGYLTAMKYTMRIISAVSGVFIGGVVATTLPMLSQFAGKEDFGRMKTGLLQSLKILFIISLPISVWLAFTSQDLLIILFERGKFVRADAELTSILIALMTPYILFSRLTSLLQIPFFSNQNMKIPAISMLISILSYSVLLLGTIQLGGGIYGFPIAHSASMICTSIFLAKMFYRYFGKIEFVDFKSFLYKMALSIALSVIAAILWKYGCEAIVIDKVIISRYVIFTVKTILIFGSFCASLIFLRIIDPIYMLKKLFNFGR
jgi:putative peptidoglycan lipid II flippase